MKISYDSKNFFDEMFDARGEIRPHYQHLAEQFEELDDTAFKRKCEAVDLAFQQQGITFTVYGDEETTERGQVSDIVNEVPSPHIAFGWPLVGNPVETP